MASKSNAKTTTENSKDQKNKSSSTSSSSYSYECTNQYVYPKMSSLFTHKSMVGARYDRKLWTDELCDKLYYYIPSDIYWDKVDLDNLDENIKLKKIKRPFEECLITARKFESMCDEYSDLAETIQPTTESGETSNKTGTPALITTTTTTTTENISASTSDTQRMIDRVRNDTEMKEKFLQCIGSYPDKKLRKHFYKVLKWKEEKLPEYDNREYFKQILKSTIKRCKKKIKKKQQEKQAMEDEQTKKIQGKILDRLDMDYMKETELVKKKKNMKYNETCSEDSKLDGKKKGILSKLSFDTVKNDKRKKSVFNKDVTECIPKHNLKTNSRNPSEIDKEEKYIKEVDTISEDSVKTEKSSKKRHKKEKLRKTRSDKVLGPKKIVKVSEDIESIHDLKRKIADSYRLMIPFPASNENINYLTVSGVEKDVSKPNDSDSCISEAVQKTIEELNMESDSEILQSLVEGGAIIKGNFLGIKPELIQTNFEELQRHNEAKNKIMAIMKTLKNVRKSMKHKKLETKRMKSSKRRNKKKMDHARKKKVLNWFKQKDYLKQMNIKKDEMKSLVSTDHLELLKRILCENKTIGTFIEHRYDFALYLADTTNNDDPSSVHSGKLSEKAKEIPYESGTSDDEVKPKIVDDDNRSRQSQESHSSKMGSTRSRSSKSSVRSTKDRKSGKDRRETVVIEDISEPDDFRDLDDWEEFMEKVTKETKEMKAAETAQVMATVDKQEILYVLRPESRRTSLPDFIYDMFETGLLPEAQEVEEGPRRVVKKVGEEAELEESELECVLEKIDSDYVVRKQIDRRLENLFENFDKARIEYTKDTAEEYHYDESVVQWQVIQHRVQQQKLLQEREERSRSFAALASSGSTVDDEPCYITDLKRVLGPKLRKAITEVLMVRPTNKPIEYLVELLHHYSYDEEYEDHMNSIDRELLRVYDDLFVNKNYGPRRFKIADDEILDSDSPYPSDSETSFDSELLEDRNVYDIIAKCKKPKQYDLRFLKANVVSSESLPTSPSELTITSILSVTSGMTVGSSIASMSFKEPSDLEIIDEDVPLVTVKATDYTVDLKNPPPLELIDGQVIFKLDTGVYAKPMINLCFPPPFNMGYPDILINQVNNMNEPIKIDLRELLPIDKSKRKICKAPFACPTVISADYKSYPSGYAMDPINPPPFDMGYPDILINEVNNMR